MDFLPPFRRRFPALLLRVIAGYPTPDVYSVTEHNQLFFFTKGKGYITTPRQAWNINEPGVFVPEFDTERFTITCSADSKEPLEFLHIVTELNDYDKTCLVESRMVLPRFRTISQGWIVHTDGHCV